MLKRILLLAVVVTTTVIGALANWVQTDKMCYEIRNDGTAYVSYRYYGDNSTQRNYYTGTVEIPESFEYESKTYKVTGIAADAFAYCSKLTKVIIPSSVVYIGGDAFQNCTALEEVVFKDGEAPVKLSYKEIKNASTGMSYISGPLFEDTPIKTLYLGRDLDTSVLTYRNKNVFSGAILENMTVGSKVTFIPALFSSQKKLSNLVIENGASEIASSAFSGCGIEKLVLPESIKKIGSSAFSNNANLTSVSFGRGIEECEYGVFKSCKAIKEVCIPDVKSWLKIKFGGDNANGLETADGLKVGSSFLSDLTISAADLPEDKQIREYSFTNCASLKTLNASDVESVGTYAFGNCVHLKNVQFNQSLKSISSHTFYKCTELETVNLGNSLQSVGDYAFNLCAGLKVAEGFDGLSTYSNYMFSGCSSLASMPVNNSLTTIKNGAFSDCSSLSKVTIPGTVTSIENGAFSNCGTVSLEILPGTAALNFGQVCFSGTSISSLTIARDFTTTAFAKQPELTSLTLKEGLTTIPASAFANCTGLTSLAIPAGIISIGEKAFEGCSSINKIVFEDSAESLSMGSASVPVENLTEVYIGRNLSNSKTFANAKKLTVVTFGTNITFIPTSCFAGCSSLRNVDIPESVTSINNSAFQDCTGLTEFNFPGSINSVDAGVLSGCTGLTEIVIPSSVKSVGASAFNNCTALQSVRFEKSSENITMDESSFGGCPIASVFIGSNITVKGMTSKSPFNTSTLSNVEFAEGVTLIGHDMFHNCVNLTHVTLPSTLTYISPSAFEGCTELVLANMPESVQSIQRKAFKNCKKLGLTKFPSKLGLIEDSAFEGCELKDITIPGYTAIRSRSFADCGIEKLTIRSGCQILSDSFTGNPKLFSFSDFESTQTTISFQCDFLNVHLLSYESGEKTPCIAYVSRGTGKAEDVKSGAKVILKGLTPETSYDVYLAPGFVIGSLKTKTISASLKQEGEIYANNYSVRVHYGSLGDAELKYAQLKANKQTWDVTDNDLISVNVPVSEYPQTVYANLVINVSGKAIELEIPISIPGIQWENETATATSLASARLMADVNLNTTEGFTGIEWRRNDAPANVKSQEAMCPVVNQTLVGSLYGLKDDVYYQFRPYYQLTEDTRSYGQWTGFYTGDATVFFEPEVVTMKYTLEPNSVIFEGMALAGTDKIVRQGFEYRKIEKYKARADGDWIQVEASGILMHAQVKDLIPEQEYEFRSFVTTSASTYYGDVVTFETLPGESGISEVVPDAADKYTIQLATNPVIDSPEIMINSDAAHNLVRVFTIEGREVYSANVESGEWINLEIYLASGHYIVYATDGISQSAVHMIVK